jgi:hypothetical protein
MRSKQDCLQVRDTRGPANVDAQAPQPRAGASVCSTTVAVPTKNEPSGVSHAGNIGGSLDAAERGRRSAVARTICC